jgi:hypothetical protein
VATPIASVAAPAYGARLGYGHTIAASYYGWTYPLCICCLCMSVTIKPVWNPISCSLLCPLY